MESQSYIRETSQLVEIKRCVFRRGLDQWKQETFVQSNITQDESVNSLPKWQPSLYTYSKIVLNDSKFEQNLTGCQ